MKESFPHAKILVRAYDQVHARELFQAVVDFQIRETFEYAFKFGEESLKILGVPEFEIESVAEEMRRRNAERIQIKLVEGADAGKRFLKSNQPTPAPLVEPQKVAIALNPEAKWMSMDKPKDQKLGPFAVGRRLRGRERLVLSERIRLNFLLFLSIFRCDKESRGQSAWPISLSVWLCTKFFERAD